MYVGHKCGRFFKRKGSVCSKCCMRDMYVVGLVWGTCMPCILEEGQVCSKFCMRDTCVVNFVWGKRMWWVLYKGLACARFCIWGIYVIRQMHEGEHSNWLYKTILQLSYLYQVELSLFSTKAFSKLNFPFSLTKYFQTYPSFVSTCNKITIIYYK